MNRLRLGTRGSALALAQARLVHDRLLALFPSLQIETIVIKTTGDKLAESAPPPPPGKGIFVKEIEEALLEGRVDLAVHSMKDLPTELAPGLVLGAVLERDDPRDCLVSRFGEQLFELPRGSLVGTGSLRRQAQVLAAKKGVRVRDLRGNLDTRLRKVMNGDFTSIVVAYAGLRRLKREDQASEILSWDKMLPAPAQGCLALEARENDAAVLDSVSKLNHAPTAAAAAAERSLLAALGGGCRVPIAAYAREEKGEFLLDGLVISPDGSRQARGQVKGAPSAAVDLGRALGDKLKSLGASALLSAVK